MTNAGTPSPSNAFDDAVQDILEIIELGFPGDGVGVGPKFDDPSGSPSTLYFSTLNALMVGLISPTTHNWTPEDRRRGMAAIGQFMTTFTAGNQKDFLSYSTDDLTVLSGELVRLKGL